MGPGICGRYMGLGAHVARKVPGLWARDLGGLFKSNAISGLWARDSSGMSLL